jgi:hypothetical protein
MVPINIWIHYSYCASKNNLCCNTTKVTLITSTIEANQVGDDQPNGGWGICGVLLNRIGNQLMLVLLEELE